TRRSRSPSGFATTPSLLDKRPTSCSVDGFPANTSGGALWWGRPGKQHLTQRRRGTEREPALSLRASASLRETSPFSYRQALPPRRAVAKDQSCGPAVGCMPTARRSQGAVPAEAWIASIGPDD